MGCRLPEIQFTFSLSAEIWIYNIIFQYCPINFYQSNIIKISHFVRNDNQLFIFGVGVRKRRSRFLTPTPTKIHLITCHSERSDESTYFCRTLVIIFKIIG